MEKIVQLAEFILISELRNYGGYIKWAERYLMGKLEATTELKSEHERNAKGLKMAN